MMIMKTLLLGATAAMALSGAAAAATCEETVAVFARDNGLNITMPERRGEQAAGPTTTPATAESRGLTATDKLAETGGVIKPPETGSAMVMTPPATSDRMQTAPGIQPNTPAGSSPSAKPAEMDAAKRAQAEAMLFAARNAAQEGKQEQCFERLQQAQRLVGRSGG